MVLSVLMFSHNCLSCFSKLYYIFHKLWNCWKIWIGKFRKTIRTSGWPRATNKARISLSIKTDSLRVATWKMQSKTKAKPSTAWSTLQWGPRSDWVRWLEPLAISCRAMKRKFYVQRNNGGSSRHSSMYVWHIWPCNASINYTGLEPDVSKNSLLFMKYHRSLFVFRSLTTVEYHQPSGSSKKEYLFKDY